MNGFAKGFFLIISAISFSAAASFEIRLSPDGPAESMFHEIYETKVEAEDNLQALCSHFPRHRAILIDAAKEQVTSFSCADINTRAGNNDKPVSRTSSSL